MALGRTLLQNPRPRLRRRPHHLQRPAAKPSRNLKLNDLLHIRNEAGEFDIHVLSLEENRGSAAIAQTLYSETDESRAVRLRLAAERETERKLNPQSDTFRRGKPTKRDRRQIHSFRGEF